MTAMETMALANVFFQEQLGCSAATLMDADTHWLGFSDRADEVGGYGVKIDKQTGAVERFILPDAQNFALLNRAVRVEL